MKNIFLVFLFATHVVLAQGQLFTRDSEIHYPDNCKFIKGFKDGKLMQVHELDKTKKVVFDNYKNYITAVLQKTNGATDQIITVKYENELGIVRSTRLFISIEYLNYDLKGNQTDSYTKVKLFEGTDSLLFTCSSREELMRYPKVLETASSTDIDSKTIKQYNLKGNIEREVYFDSKGDTALTKTYQYNENNQKSNVYTHLPEIYPIKKMKSFEYSNTFPTKISKESEYYGNTHSYRTNTYDKKGRLVELCHFSNERLISSTTMIYNKSGRVKKSLRFSGASDTPSSRTLNSFDIHNRLTKSISNYEDINLTFFYNKNELITKVVEVDNLTKKKTISTYSYEFGFYL